MGRLGRKREIKNPRFLGSRGFEFGTWGRGMDGYMQEVIYGTSGLPAPPQTPPFNRKII